jgi:hypothetical protein
MHSMRYHQTVKRDTFAEFMPLHFSGADLFSAFFAVESRSDRGAKNGLFAGPFGLLRKLLAFTPIVNKRM